MAVTLMADSSAASYAPIGLLLSLTIVSAVGMVLLSHFVGPRRKGSVKDSPYESGMPVIGDARRRFNVKFYIVAMVFLLFDVEIVFLWPGRHYSTKPLPIRTTLPLLQWSNRASGRVFCWRRWGSSWRSCWWDISMLGARACFDGVRWAESSE